MGEIANLTWKACDNCTNAGEEGCKINTEDLTFTPDYIREIIVCDQYEETKE